MIPYRFLGAIRSTDPCATCYRPHEGILFHVLWIPRRIRQWICPRCVLALDASDAIHYYKHNRAH